MAKTAPDTRDWYKASFAGFEKSLNGSGDRTQQLRRQALDRFAESGLPTHRQESWRHTNPAPLSGTEFHAVLEAPGEPLAPADISAWSMADLGLVELVFVDGHYVPDLSGGGGLPEGVRAQSLAAALKETPDAVLEQLGADSTVDSATGDGGFAALNTAFLRDGGYICVPRGVEVETPVHLLYLSSGRYENAVSHPRTLVVVGDSASVSVLETFAGLEGSRPYLTNAVAEIAVGANAAVEHLKLHREAAGAYHMGTLKVLEERDARFTSHNLALSGALVRNDITTTLNGEGIDSTLNGLFLGAGDEQIDNYTTIEHASPHCSSHELYKGVLTDRARGVFRGKIHVHQVAQKTDAYQSNQNLLLSDDADITSKPQLEIYADDVKCSHGSTTGQLDRDAIFYLQTRGLSRPDAIHFLTQAFAGEVVDRIGHEGVRQRLGPLVRAKLEEELAGSIPA